MPMTLRRAPLIGGPRAGGKSASMSCIPSSPFGDTNRDSRKGTELSFGILHMHDISEPWSLCLRRRGWSARQISERFAVTERTAEYWLACDREPRGRHLAAYMRQFPEDIPYLTGEVDRP